jgi:DNA-binding XRE family transcriptional regulator
MTLLVSDDYSVGVPHSEYEKVIRDLIEYCASEWGRQTELAEHLKVSRKTVNAWVNGTRRPSIEMFFELKAFLRSHRRKRRGRIS